MFLVKKKPMLTAGSLLIASSVMAGFAYNKKYSPAIWSIHVSKTDVPITRLDQAADFQTPALTPEDVTDVPAVFVADPFLMQDENGYCLFFEVMNGETERGEIGLATSEDGETWVYDRIVLKEDVHLSYPHVIKQGDDYYMIPESVEAEGIYLYKAASFPHEWQQVKKLVSGDYTDASLFQYNHKWWMYAAGLDNKTLYLFWADELEGEWRPHPKSPLIKNDKSNSRPAGRVVIEDGRIYRYAQDDGPYYGHSIKGFEVTHLSEAGYEEKEIGVLLKGSGIEGDWRQDGMHHIDHLKLAGGGWLAAVDGHRFNHQNYILWKVKSMFR
ncbi:hypothetical protein RRU94_10410 [Domibacillus sp. DTU_2020_1001157_1_SI_ALB_TIR_016]|uniref:glucosamine inositolphosphorylceramide transferase family protein n=1 Tax=Domibacillus sp. DTU_2020_1001157_1_SI_ALB_TIR_016 TaxID=3077789 RepID=UPI0028E3F753|nr:hypothetical protein [Domibacillus sp. DTU_2020_1001157_1_SI_ALB_TIR_016]WNS81214.1 hypothetical protein RRU94_10410 [Domibacillus sp. DTU_2020_1001157_1_SI_ALB_TIR_016]